MDETRGPIRFIHEQGKRLSQTRFCDELTALLPRLRRFARGLTHDSADGDDLCQATLERALKSRHQWQDGTRLDAWVYRIMRNLWIDETRSRSRRSQTFVDEEQGLAIGDGGDRVIEARVELGRVGRAMGTLPEEQREAVMLVLVEGYAYKEAAEMIGCPMGTLTSRLVRGREALMRELGEA